MCVYKRRLDAYRYLAGQVEAVGWVPFLTARTVAKATVRRAAGRVPSLSPFRGGLSSGLCVHTHTHECRIA